MSDEKFIKKWGKTRTKGKFLHIIRFGLLLCGIGGGAGFLIMSILIEMAAKESFVLADFIQTNKFLIRFLLSVIVFPLAGIFIGISNWKSNEKRYKSLTYYNPF